MINIGFDLEEKGFVNACKVWDNDWCTQTV